MKKQSFGKTSDGRPVDLYTLTNQKGMEVAITNFGGIVVSLKVPDRTGKFEQARIYRRACWKALGLGQRLTERRAAA